MDYKLIIFFLVTLSSFSSVFGQRRRNWADINREESLPKKAPPPQPKKDIGEFPYNRGETPIFNFDQGDEAFLKTIPSLIEGLHDMARYVQAQSKVTAMYGKVFQNCPDCKP